MKDYIIVTDSTTDLTSSQIDEMELSVLPLKFRINDEEYSDLADKSEIKFEDFFAMLRSGKQSTTSQISPSEFISAVEPFVKDGKDILYIAFSSALSGTYNSASTGAELLKEKYPDVNIRVIDSLCASGGEGLLVYLAVQKKREGYSLDKLADWLENERLHLCHWFTVDDLNHLKRGGRVSAVTALLGTTLSIKPVLHVDNEGRLINVKKVRGRKQSLDALVDMMEATAINPTEQTIFITHGDCFEDAKYVADTIKAKFNVKDVVINPLGPVIGSHSGPGTMALFFWGTSR